MSAASTPAPRAKSSSSDGRPSSPRHTLFWPMFILLMSMGVLECYEVMSMEDQLDTMTQEVDKLNAKVQLAKYEKDKFYMIASAVLRMAPKDPNADQVATLFGLRQLQIDKPELMNANLPSDLPTDTSAPGSTNAAPAKP